MLRVDLGCGPCKQEGFIGLDRFPFPCVDIVADLDNGLPFESDSVDLLFASHSLEHVRDLMAIMKEIYRVCKHGSQVCIVAPYHEQKLNIANPYHLSVFNEHTPRFWTDCPETPLSPADFSHPHAGSWGLSRSDHSDPGIDIRTVAMEFFYFPDYRFMPIEEQRRYRRERFDVCDQIMYHSIIWKSGDHCHEYSYFLDHVASIELFEPCSIHDRRQVEQQELFKYFGESKNLKSIRVDEIKSSLRRIDRLLSELGIPSDALSETQFDVKRLAQKVSALTAENTPLHSQMKSVEPQRENGFLES